MSTLHAARALLVLPLALACTPPDDKSDGDDNGTEDALYQMCDAVRTPLEAGALAPDGSDPAAALALLGSASAGAFTYAAGGATDFVLTPDAAAAQLAWVDQEPHVDDSDGGGAEPAIAADCPDYLVVSFPIAFSTADGAFAFDGTIEISVGNPSVGAEDYARGLVSVATGDFGGTHDWSVYLTPDTTSLEAELFLSYAADGSVAGTVSAYSTGEDGETAWAGTDEVGSFAGAPAVE